VSDPFENIHTLYEVRAALRFEDGRYLLRAAEPGPLMEHACSSLNSNTSCTAATSSSVGSRRASHSSAFSPSPSSAACIPSACLDSRSSNTKTVSIPRVCPTEARFTPSGRVGTGENPEGVKQLTPRGLPEAAPSLQQK
jgi:hypothetical protein